MTARILEETDHRPWPLPDRPWTYAQRWTDLLFAHWPVEPAALRPLVPGALPVDTFDDRAWVGVVPFRLSRLRPRGLPPFPGVSRFPELNVRTYTTVEGKPGVYFFSLDAASALAVLGARLAFRLPYYHAKMSARAEGDAVVYRSRRRAGPLGAGSRPPGLAAVDSPSPRPLAPEEAGDVGRPPAGRAAPGRADDAPGRDDAGHATLVVRYRPTGPVREAAPGSLEHFLTERYCLYTIDRRGRPLRVDIHHRPWPLQPADAGFETNTMAAAAGIPLPDEPPLLHFSRRQDTVGWMPRRMRTTLDTTATQ